MRKWKSVWKRSRPWCCIKTGTLPYVYLIQYALFLNYEKYEILSLMKKKTAGRNG